MTHSSQSFYLQAILIALTTLAWDAKAAPLLGQPMAEGGEKRVDNPVDAWMTAQIGPAGKLLKPAEKWARRFEILDPTDAKAGDYSIRFTITDAARQGALGFISGRYFDGWALDRDFSLHMWMKAAGAVATTQWQLVLYDTAGNRVQTALESPGDGWREMQIPLAKFQADAKFDFGAVRSVQIEVSLPQGACVWLDDVYFAKGEQVLGLSDKTITQYMSEASRTRPLRVEEGLNFPEYLPDRKFVSPLYKGENLEKVNADIRKYIADEMAKEDAGERSVTWGLWVPNLMHRLYFGFSSKGRIHPGRLSPETEKALLELIWRSRLLKNDIASARHSSWWVDASENHDFNTKVGNLLASQIFMHEPDYADRVYPDLGRMIGYHYDRESRALGSGNYKDGKSYRSREHYEEWVKFWRRFFTDRAKHGFFIEHNATGYMAHTNRILYDLYAYCEDQDLRRQCRMFIDLIWAQWAQDQMLTIQGGDLVRWRPGDFARMGSIVEFLLGAPGARAAAGYHFIFSDYELPRQVWEMLLDRRGKGEFAYVSRKPNEEQDVDPRPAGTEYTMLIRPDSRLARYSWATPDYVLGLRMDHPMAMYAHLSVSAAQLTFPTSPSAEVLFWTGDTGGPQLYYQAVQDRNVALVQPKRTWLLRHPTWIVGYAKTHQPMTILFGKDIDRIEEKDGWVFVEEGNAFAAFRLVWPVAREKNNRPQGDAEGFVRLTPATDTYQWAESENPKRWSRALVAKETLAALIVETSRRAHHADLAAFQKDVLDNPMVLRHVLGGFTLTYKGCGPEARELYMNCANNETPKIDGQYIRYDCPTFDSPYLQGKTGDGVVTLIGPISGKKLVLDFNNNQRSEP